ncbi:copper chaperone PCu(A)C [Polycladidibacter stylochi]|uniref:copper chaperone PCu(A)C n=1 Tax=Polycladidibacter stylochi TaxID=1807766 RepID=UPI0008319F17|nr:copper chaperone PCu(A)C [Pseudovibrio stylochi]
MTFKKSFTTISMGLLLAVGMSAPSFADNHGHGHKEHGHKEHETHKGHESHEAHKEGAEHDHAEHSEHLSVHDGLRVVHAWTPATKEDHALVYFELENESKQTKELKGAESAIATSAQIVGFRFKNGEGGYDSINVLPLGAGQHMEFAPNELAVLLDGLKKPLHQGDSFELELHIDNHHMDIHVAVEAQGATQHSHAGHQH